MKSSNYTHKEWQKSNSYEFGIYAAAKEYSCAMVASFELGKIFSPTIYKSSTKIFSEKNHGYSANSIDNNKPEYVLKNLRMGCPVLVAVRETGDCPFTDNSNTIVLYGVDKKNNCKILNPNDYFYVDKNYKYKDGTSRRQTSCIKGYSDKLTWPWATIKKHFMWAVKIDGPTSQKIRAELDKWVNLQLKEMNKSFTISYNLNGGKVSGTGVP